MDGNFLALVLFLSIAAGNALPLDSEDNKRKIFAKINQINSVIVDIQCMAVSTYFEGTFQNPKHQEYSFDAQFQIKFELDPHEQRIFLTRQYWNNSLSSMDKVIYGFATAKTADW